MGTVISASLMVKGHASQTDLKVQLYTEQIMDAGNPKKGTAPVDGVKVHAKLYGEKQHSDTGC